MKFVRLQKFFGKFTSANFPLPIIFLFLLIMCIFGFFINFFPTTDLSPCYIDSPFLLDKMGEGNSKLIKLDDVLISKIQPDKGKSIFFHETSCPHMSVLTSSDLMYPHEDLQLNLVSLNARQACAVESAARNNPSQKVFVLFASPHYMKSNSKPLDPIIDAILSYENVNLRNLNLWSYAASTPVYDLLKNGALFNSKYVVSHLSDFLRYLTLWRWGGTYLDLDVVVLRSMEDVPPNYTGAESNTDLAAGVMNFAHDGFGHEIAEQCLLELQHNFDGSNWGYNGPGVITRVLKRICQTNSIELMQNNVTRCKGFKVFPTDAFYAIPWLEWPRFFESELLQETMDLMKNSFVAHVWNKNSVDRKIKAGTKCAYSVLAAKHCPRVYKAAGDYF